MSIFTTPGTWLADDSPTTDCWQITAESDHEPIALLFNDETGEPFRMPLESEANANLIAAAPEMYEALLRIRQAILDVPEAWAIPVFVEDLMRHALWKANGHTVPR